jgi:molybdate transport system substrate-binding protein
MMRKRIVSLAIFCGIALLCTDVAAAQAAEITVLSSTGVKTALVELAPQFEKATGNKLNIIFNASNLLKKDVDAGASFDVIILTPSLINELIKEGKVADGSAADVARVGIGIAVKKGAPKPDISSVAAFKRTLVDAKSIAYTTAGQSGLQFTKVIENLGIADQVKAKGKTLPGGSAGELIVKGEADMAVQLMSELMAVPGIEVVGPFPKEIQSYVVLTAGVGANTKDKSASQALIKFLTAPSAAPVIKAKGMEPG